MIDLANEAFILLCVNKTIWIMITMFNMSYFDAQLVNAPSSAVAAPPTKTKVPQVEPVGNDDSGIDSDLQARLDNLRKM